MCLKSIATKKSDVRNSVEEVKTSLAPFFHLKTRKKLGTVSLSHHSLKQHLALFQMWVRYSSYSVEQIKLFDMCLKYTTLFSDFIYELFEYFSILVYFIFLPFHYFCGLYLYVLPCCGHSFPKVCSYREKEKPFLGLWSLNGELVHAVPTCFLL